MEIKNKKKVFLNKKMFPQTVLPENKKSDRNHKIYFIDIFDLFLILINMVLKSDESAQTGIFVFPLLTSKGSPEDWL